jgi:cytochrome P450
LATSYDLAKSVLTDPRFSVQPKDRFPIGDPAMWRRLRGALEQAGLHRLSLLELDPPDHSRYRRLVAAPFGMRAIEGHRGEIEQIVLEHLVAMEQAGPPQDLVQAYATPIALSTHCAILGLPPSDGAWLADLRLGRLDSESDLNRAISTWHAFGERLQPVIESKRKTPGDDFMSYVVQLNEFDDSEIASLVGLLFVAGHGPTIGMLAVGVFSLLANPEALAALRIDPSLDKSAVDELLRFITIPQTGLTRTATEDLRIGGVLIREGESVTVSQAAANRDPCRFVDPDALDLTRSAAGHLSFGQGVHFCLGQHLARLELQVAIGALIRRFPSLHLAVDADELRFHGGDFIDYGVRELPVAW